MIRFRHKGDFEKTTKFFNVMLKGDYKKVLAKYGEMGVAALKEATPKRTGKTSESWSYSIEKTKKGVDLVWSNSNTNHGISIALLIQQGHGMPSGYYVEGIDYINPALKPIFDALGKDAWEEVSRLA